MNTDSASAVREAFAAGEYAKARKLWESHTSALDAAIRAGQATRAMLDETGDLLEWAKLLMRVQRASGNEELDGAHAAAAYADGPASIPTAGVKAVL